MPDNVTLTSVILETSSWDKLPFKYGWRSRLLTIGAMSQPLRQWVEWSGIGSFTIYQRLERGELALQSLTRPDRAGRYLKLHSPAFPWSDIQPRSKGTIALQLQCQENGVGGIEALYQMAFGENGLAKFEDILPEFVTRDQANLAHLKQQMALKVTEWEVMGKPSVVTLVVARTDLAYLTEVFLRRQSIFAIPQPKPQDTHAALAAPPAGAVALQMLVVEESCSNHSKECPPTQPLLEDNQDLNYEKDPSVERASETVQAELQQELDDGLPADYPPAATPNDQDELPEDVSAAYQAT